jgi:hypothetical protein
MLYEYEQARLAELIEKERRRAEDVRALKAAVARIRSGRSGCLLVQMDCFNEVDVDELRGSLTEDECYLVHFRAKFHERPRSYVCQCRGCVAGRVLDE